jgi:hypothetical protein
VKLYEPTKMSEDRILSTSWAPKLLIVSAVILLLLTVFGCASLGLATPKGFDQQLAEAYGVHTAVATAATTAVATRAITAAEATAVNSQVISSRQLLDAARQIETSNPTGANNDLVLATTALTALQTYLNTHQKGN